MNDITADGIVWQAEQLGELKSAVLEATPNAVAIADREGIVVWVNPAFRQLTGYNVGNALTTIFSPDNPTDLLQSIRAGGCESDGWSGECFIRRRDGTGFPAFLNVRPIKDKEGRFT